MKKVLFTAVIVGVAAAVAIYITTNSSTVFKRRSAGGSNDDIADAAGNAYKEMNRHVGKVERKTEDIIDKAFA